MKLIKKLIDWFEDLLWTQAIKDVFENPDNNDSYEESKSSCHFANCKFCPSFIHERIPDEDGIAVIRCDRKHKRIELRETNPDIIDGVTPEIFDEIDSYEEGGEVNVRNYKAW